MILVVWVAGFLVGTTTHVLDLIAGGSAVYAGFPEAVRWFWIALTFLDPLTAILLIMRRHGGIVLALVVILSDVAVNWPVALTIGGLSPMGIACQSLFAVVVVVTTPTLWSWFHSRQT